jgi:hypothetical protein
MVLKILNGFFVIWYVAMAIICFTGTIPFTPFSAGMVSLIAALNFLQFIIND